MSYTQEWLLSKATLEYEYYRDPIKTIDDANEYIRFFVKHNYTFEVWIEGKQTDPSADSIVAKTKVVLTNGQVVERGYPSLTPSVSGTAGFDYLTYGDGGEWRVANIRYRYNVINGKWTTHVVIAGEWNKFTRVSLTNNIYTYR